MSIQLSLTAINVPAFGVKTEYNKKTLIQLSLTAINVPVFGVRWLIMPVTLFPLCYGRCVIKNVTGVLWIFG